MTQILIFREKTSHVKMVHWVDEIMYILIQLLVFECVFIEAQFSVYTRYTSHGKYSKIGNSTATRGCLVMALSKGDQVRVGTDVEPIIGVKGPETTCEVLSSECM